MRKRVTRATHDLQILRTFNSPPAKNRATLASSTRFFGLTLQENAHARDVGPDRCGGKLRKIPHGRCITGRLEHDSHRETEKSREFRGGAARHSRARSQAATP